MPTTGPLSRVSSILESRRDRHEHPVDGAGIRLGALLVFLGLVVLMVLVANPAVAASADPEVPTREGMANLAAILFWAVVAIGLVVRAVLNRRPVRSEHPPAASRRRAVRSTKDPTAA